MVKNRPAPLSTKILAILQEAPATARDVCDEMGWPLERLYINRACGLLCFLRKKGLVQKVAHVKGGRDEAPMLAALYGPGDLI